MRLLIFCLVAMSMALQSSKQGQMKAEISRIERLLTKFQELSEIQAFDFSKLFIAIDDLSASLKQARVDENNLYDQEFKQYVEDHAFYSDLITFYTAEVAQHTQDLRSLNNLLASYQEQLQNKIVELDQTRQQKTQLEEVIRVNEVNYLAELANFNQAIEIIDQALAILAELKNSINFIDLDPSFLQSQTGVLESISNEFYKLSIPSHRILFKPLASALVELGQSKQLRDLLKKVINHLNNLRNSLDAGRIALTNNYNFEKSQNLKLLDTYVAKIDTLENKVIPQLHEYIQDTLDNIKTKTILLNDAQSNLDEATETLAQIEQRWIKRTQYHNALLAEYENELNLIVDAIKTLEKGGVTRQ